MIKLNKSLKYMKILLLEDDLILNEIIQEHLESKKYDVTSVYSGDEAESLIYSKSFDLFLFDVNVPNINGFELLKDLRSKDIKTAAIFITSANMLDDVEKGFEVGCDDYMKKPFELRELDLRIENIKRLYKISPSNLITVSNDIYLDVENLTILKKDEKYHITKKECDVLEYLLKNHEKPISIDELCSNIWAYENAPLDSTIRNLYKKLAKNTRRRVYYKFKRSWL